MQSRPCFRRTTHLIVLGALWSLGCSKATPPASAVPPAKGAKETPAAPNAAPPATEPATPPPEKAPEPEKASEPEKAPGPEKAPEPEKAAPLGVKATVERYLELGAKGDLTQIKDLVDPACYDDPVGKVEALRMMGFLMTVDESTVEVLEESADSARVSASVKGSVNAKNDKAETTILGKPATIQVGSLTMTGVSQTNTLTLKKLNGTWHVTCSP